MVEYTAHIEAYDTVARITFDIHYRVTGGLCLRSCTIVAGSTVIHEAGVGMIGVGRQEASRYMTVAAFGVGNRVCAGWRVIRGSCFAYSDGTVMTA